MKRTETVWAAEKAATTLNPTQVESTLRQLQEKWPAEARPLPDLLRNFPLGEAALLHLMAVSSICAARFIAAPETLLWLSRPDICDAPRIDSRMLIGLYNFAGDEYAAGNFRKLRQWKGREITRISLREVAGQAPLPETMLELSQLADICLTKVHEYWDAELRKRGRVPENNFSILGLGKLGARELNHSSDVDIIFIYGETDNGEAAFAHEWFNRLAAKIVQTFSITDEAGQLFRVDLRLRPEGTHGSLARSLDSMENYYAGFGESWERLMLMKARCICGDSEVAYEFLHRHQPFIYPRSPTPDLLDEVAGIKLRIERDLLDHEELERNVKLGAGGIREIEFVVQALQLLHGARHAFLQEPSTLKALTALAELELLPAGDARDLATAYQFLRTVEHRLQIEAEQQTHTLPNDPAALRRLALSLGFSSPQAFQEKLKTRTQLVRAIFQRTISTRRVEETRPPPLSAIFKDEARAAQSMRNLEQARTAFHVATRTQQIARRLQPLLLAQLSGAADPDAALTQFVRFVEAFGMRSLLFELLVKNPRLLELLVKTFDSSRFAGDLLIRHPPLLEDITRRADFDQPVTRDEHLERLAELRHHGDDFGAARTYKQTQLLRIMLRDILGFADISVVTMENSDLLEACLLHLHRRLAPNLTVVALGKFGGRELSYGADLDVVFIGDETKSAQSLMFAMGQQTPEGVIAPTDARLRPDGEKGVLVVPLATYESYYRERAQLWELQSLTRARAVAGPLGADFIGVAQEQWRAAGKRPDAVHQIANMLERIWRDRTSGQGLLDFKTGRGGLMETEFLVQAAQMRTQIWEPNLSAALSKLAVCSREEREELRQSYDFLRSCESALRRWENKSVSVLPADEYRQGRLARWLGFESVDAFARAYVKAREAVHGIFKRVLPQLD